MARILIVEDDDAVRGFVSRAMQLDGHEVVLAVDGAEGLERLDDSGAFDLLLSDIQMPVMDGIALALSAARERPDLAIMLMTGYAEQRERAHGLDAIVRDVVNKPFSLEEIRRRVADTLAAPGGDAVAASA